MKTNWLLLKMAPIIALVLILQLNGCSDCEIDTQVTKLSDDQLSLVVVIKAKEGREAELKEAMIGLLEPTRNEKGCINFTFHTDPSDRTRFMFYENWENRELWETHLNASHIKEFGAKSEPLLAEPMDLTIWSLYD